MAKFILSFLFVLTSTKTYAAPPPETLELREFNGRRVAEILALSCSNETWKEFQAYAKRARYIDYNRAVNYKLKMDWTKNTVSIEGLDARINYSPKKFQGTIFGKTYQSRDACEFLTKIHAGGAKKAASIWRELALPSANAEELAGNITDSSMDDRMLFVAGTLAAIGSIAIGVGSGGVLGAVGVGSGFYFGYKAGNALARARMKEAMSDLLKDAVNVDCSAKQMILTSGTRRILVTKEPPKVEFEQFGKIVYDNEGTMSAKKAREYLLRMAAKCPVDVKPEALTAQAAQERKQAQDRMITLITPEEAARPASTSSDAGANR